MIITEIQYFFSKIIRFQAIFKDTVEFTCALEFKISSQLSGRFLPYGKTNLRSTGPLRFAYHLIIRYLNLNFPLIMVT